MADDARKRALAEIHELIADATYDRKVNKAERQLDLIERALKIGRDAGLPDAQIMAMVRPPLTGCCRPVIPEPEDRKELLSHVEAPGVEPLGASPAGGPGPPQLPWAPPEPPTD